MSVNISFSSTDVPINIAKSALVLHIFNNTYNSSYLLTLARPHFLVFTFTKIHHNISYFIDILNASLKF